MKKIAAIFFTSLLTYHIGAQTIKISICVIQNKQLKTVEGDYNARTGDTTITVNGSKKNFGEVYPATGREYAAGTTWYINHEKITGPGGQYEKYGLPRILGYTEVVRVGEYKGVGLYAEPSAKVKPEVIYVPVRNGCEFQPYQAVKPPCGKVTVKASATQVRAGTSVTLTAIVTGTKVPLLYSWSSYDLTLPDSKSKTCVVSTAGFNGDAYIELYVRGKNGECESYVETKIKIKE